MTSPDDVTGPGESDDAIRGVVLRLSRPHASGGAVIERAAIVAEGADAAAIVAWILAHAGEPEAVVPRASGRGLHGARLGGDPAATRVTPRRYVLPRRRSDVTGFWRRRDRAAKVARAGSIESRV